MKGVPRETSGASKPVIYAKITRLQGADDSLENRRKPVARYGILKYEINAFYTDSINAFDTDSIALTQ